MPSVRVPKELKEGIFFLTFTVHRWYYLFDRHNRWDILTDSLKYCQANKGLQIYHFVFMLNHLHLIAKSCDIPGFIMETEPHILKLFEENGEYHFWQKTNMPEVIRSVDFYLAKARYHECPKHETKYRQNISEYENINMFFVST